MSHGFVAAALAGLVFAGCTYNPATRRHQLLLLTTRQEIALGEEAKPQLTEEYGGEVAAPQLRSYVGEVGVRLARRTEADYPRLPWEFVALESEVVNAFALPGGKVFISKGLLRRLTSEAQLAAVLGHEIGHVTARHVDERLSQAMVVQGIVLGAVAATSDSDSELGKVLPLLVGAGGQGYLLKFGRDQEREADEQGVKYLAAARYDPRAMLEVLMVLAEASRGRRVPEIFSTHPDPESRIGGVRRLLKGPYSYTQGSPEYQDYPDRFQQRALPYLGEPDRALGSGSGGVPWCQVCGS